MDYRVLPEELWSYIADLLSSTAPSVRNIREEPTLSLTRSSDRPLKNLSLVSVTLRRIALPVLFRYSRLRIVLPIHQDHEKARNVFASKQRKQSSESESNGTSTTSWTTPFPMQSEYRDFLAFVRTKELAKAVQSFALICDRPFKKPMAASFGRTTPAERFQAAIDTFWEEIFTDLDPQRVVIVASPNDMVDFTNASLDLSNEWVFADMELHALELSRPNTDCASTPLGEQLDLSDHVQHIPGFSPSSIVKMRRWQHIGLNEGSFLRAYASYEYFEHGAPSSILSIKHSLAIEIRRRLLSNAGDRQMLQQTFTYTAIFPFASHADLTTILESCAEVDLQLAPNSRSRSFNQHQQSGHMDLQECWWELLEAYHNLVDAVRTFGRISDGNFPFLEKITSRDFGIPALREELDNACTPMCLPVWAEYQSGLFVRLVIPASNGSGSAS